ncbi:MAG: glycosyltransferase, partial [Candidatus Omnitrophota bacterium]
FVAISHHVKNRIAAHYKREADVIYPPADTDFYSPDPSVGPEDFYLVVSALVPYKKIELAVEAFNHLGKRLVVIGGGPEENFLRSKAKSNIEFLGWQTDGVLRDTYRRARALVFPGEEDFGIVPVEVQACGRFVIAYGKGGAVETVKDGETGVFFGEPSVESLSEAVRRFETLTLRPENARQNALRFSRDRFKREMDEMVKRVLA